MTKEEFRGMHEWDDASTFHAKINQVDHLIQFNCFHVKFDHKAPRGQAFYPILMKQSG